MTTERSNATNLGRIIFHKNYDKKPISPDAASSIDLKQTVNMCHAEDGYLTACDGWKNLLKVKKTVPYTFGMSQALWDHVKARQPFEYDMALHFGLQFDLREIEASTPGLIYTEYFHTLMYLRFASYLKNVATSRAGKAIIELSKDVFDIRVAANYKDIEGLVKLAPSGMGMYSKASYVAYAAAIPMNRGPFYIDQVLYEVVFGDGKKWNRKAYNLAVSEYGYERPLSEMRKMGD